MAEVEYCEDEGKEWERNFSVYKSLHFGFDIMPI